MSDANLEVEEFHFELSLKGLQLKKAEIITVIAIISAFILAVFGMWLQLYGS